MKRFLLLYGAVAALLPLSAGPTPAAAATVAYVRYFNLPPDFISNVNFNEAGARVLTYVPYKGFSAYFQVSAGSHDFVARPFGSSSNIVEMQQTLTAGSYYSLVVSGKHTDPRVGLYSDSPSQTAGKVVV